MSCELWVASGGVTDEQYTKHHKHLSNVLVEGISCG